jgi:hypothetical protein
MDMGVLKEQELYISNGYQTLFEMVILSEL